MSQTLRHAKVAYLSGVIPALSETFIYREIFEVERRGYTLHLYALHRPNRGTVSADSLPLCDRTYYLLPAKVTDVLAAHAYYACRHLLRYFCTIWKMLSPFHHHFKDRIRTFFHCGEGVVLARKMQKDSITHVHCQYIDHTASVARTIHLLTGISYSISAHTYDIWHDRLLLSHKLSEARFIVCCSASSRKELIKHGHPAHASRVHVVYHGVDTRLFVPPTENGVRNKNLILTVGRLDPVKGFISLIEACRELEEQGVEFACEIVGNGPQKEELAALIQKYRLGAKVSLKGAVLQENILSYYHRASIFVLPCATMQGIPNVLMEAMACGLPVISTALGGITELIENGRNGFFVPPSDPKGLAERLKQLLEDASLRQEIGEAARKKMQERFDNRKTIEPLIELLRCEAHLQTCV